MHSEHYIGILSVKFQELKEWQNRDIFKEIYHEKVFAMDEDTAMDQVLDELDKKGVPYGICMAEEMGQ